MTNCPALPAPEIRMRPRTALLASADSSFRRRLNDILTGLRWQVREAQGGADAWRQAQAAPPQAVIVDSWLPDLDCGEFLKEFGASFPTVELLSSDGSFWDLHPGGPHRGELLLALRRTQESDQSEPSATGAVPAKTSNAGQPTADIVHEQDRAAPSSLPSQGKHGSPVDRYEDRFLERSSLPAAARLPEFVGTAACMIEVSRRIRLVAPRSTPVLIEGPTGSGKELVAQALHRLSTRNRRPFVAINCAAIPEALLEAELFGHTRGAFTGAIQGRVGRIEAADGGTLFLDEIGEMPLALQAKLLRFVESGELQRVGDNETVKVDVRVIAATHRPLAQHTVTGAFRADLYYRLAVFLIRTPALLDHLDDLPLLVEHFLEKMGREVPVKKISAEALAKLAAHTWPGNVRELEHVLERAAILAGDMPELTALEIDFGAVVN